MAGPVGLRVERHEMRCELQLDALISIIIPRFRFNIIAVLKTYRASVPSRAYLGMNPFFIDL